ncbi:MAG: stage III sporulation protein AF [Clostridia bacterium]|nr:stage III sporulation protein AF [Clostridia bacterium]
MDMLKEWALCLMAAAAAGTLAVVIVPRGSMDKTVRAVVGIFVVAVICAPLSEIENFDFSVEAFANYGEVPFDNTHIDDMNLQMINICKKAVEEQIKKTADEQNVTAISVEADISVDAENCIIIHKIDVCIDDGEFLSADLLSEKFSEKLGVPVVVNVK